MRSCRLCVVMLCLTAANCTPALKMHRLRSDYGDVDRTRTKRLVILTQPLPGQDPRVGQLFSLVARRYVNQKRNFLAKRNVALAEPVSLTAVCSDVEGVLWIRPSLEPTNGGVEGSIFAALMRCSDAEEIWAAEAGGSFRSADARLKEVTADYVSELGRTVEPYVAPAFNLLRPLLDTLPEPSLTEDEVDEKIELGE